MASLYTERIVTYNNAADSVEQAEWALKKWVWVVDKELGYLAAYVVKEHGDKMTIKVLEEAQERIVNVNSTEKMNPPKFNRAEDMADLTHLNEASVVHNLKLRYQTNLIYTYSGLFLVAVNPYKKLPLYSDDMVKLYKGKKRSDLPPHIFAVADASYYAMLQSKENQSILITGESGAGKTENTKKVIQYLTQIAADSTGEQMGTLEHQILQANPILESFGNAQTIRNNNSSRFGKFIRIEFSNIGHISGANIERYLLEKSRVTHQTAKERNYHIFYQLLKGGADIKKEFLLDGNMNDYEFVKHSNKDIEGVDDAADFKALRESFDIMKFSNDEQCEIFRSIASVLHLGNLSFVNDSEDQAQMTPKCQLVAEKVCHVLGIPVAEFTKALLKPKIKAGRDWVVQARNVQQVDQSVEALARAVYERMFGKLVDRINEAIYSPGSKSAFIGVLDIAGFEIFDVNSFEQICINLTNEKLQQFFNHHMFILEQEEYRRENIEWTFIDFGLDLLPTIDLIEKTTPIGILSLLDEECVMPRATDKTFIDKLNQLWKGKSNKYEVPRFNEGFILNHYAGKVEYSTVNWLDKNKDPLNENVTRLLANSSDKYIASLFSDYQGDQESTNAIAGRAGIMKKGAFRTVAQRHKEQLASLMGQLNSTEPHFVRCIIPNEEKKPGKINLNLALDQLRCNGVLEGIRICRAGFPNRLPFSDFRQRYEILALSVIPKGFMDGRQATLLLLEALALDKNQFRLGNTKVFFRAGVLAELEEMRDVRVSKIVTRIQAVMRGFLARKKFKRRIDQARAIRIIQRNARIYITLREWAWWKLYAKIKPLLNVTRTDEELRKKEEAIKELEDKAAKDREDRVKLDAYRAQLEAEKKTIEDMLISEQNASSTQNEILKRVQQREADLAERLKELNAQLEEKDLQNDDMRKKKVLIDAELVQLRDKLTAQRGNLDKLEKEKALRDIKVAQLEENLASESNQGQKLDVEKKSLETQIAQLKTQVESLHANEADLTRSKKALTAQIDGLEKNLAQESDDKSKLDHKRASLEIDLRTITEQLSASTQSKSDMDVVLKRKEAEMVELAKKLDAETVEKNDVDRQRRELQLKLSFVEGDLASEREDMVKLSKLKKKLEDELAQYGRLVEQKGNEESKQTELRKLRDNEVTELKSQIASLQAEHDDNRKRSNVAIENLKADIETITLENQTMSRLKQTVEKQLNEVKSELENTEESRGKSERSRKQLEADLQASQDNCSGLESLLSEAKSNKESLEKHISIANARVSEAEMINTRIERERSALLKQVDTLTDEIEQESSRRAVVEGQKKKMQLELHDVQARLDEDELSRIELTKKLAAKTTEVDELKDRMSVEIQGRIAELEEMKRKADTENAELGERNAEFERNLANLEKTKARLSAEIEDSRLEIEREHNVSRHAEKQVKHIEIQLASSVAHCEAERKQKDLAESSARKLQNTIETLTLEIQQRELTLQSLQKAKNDTDHELNALTGQVGEGGKIFHDLAKHKKRAEEIQSALKAQLDAEESKLLQSEDQRASAEQALDEMRQKLESSMQQRDEQIGTMRDLLLKEVNSSGQQVIELTSQRVELLKQKKRLEEQVDELANRAEYSEKGQSDLEKNKKKSDLAVRELHVKLEAEEKAKKAFEELALRHEKKSNSLQSEIEKLELQIDVLDRQRKLVEKNVEDLKAELEGTESKATVQEARKRFERDLHDIQLKLDESEEVRNALEAAKNTNSSELDSLRMRAREEFEDKYESLSEKHKALVAVQKLALGQIEERVNEISNLEKQRRNQQGEIDDLKTLLETHTLAKADETAARKRISNEMKEIQSKLDMEYVKSFELNDSMNTYRQRADQAQSNLEITEQSNQRFVKSDALQKTKITEIERDLQESKACAKLLEEQLKDYEEGVSESQQKHEEDVQEVAELQVIKRRLTDELERISEIHKNDSAERELAADGLRKKYQKEVKSLIDELEIEKRTTVSLKEGNKDLEIENETLTSKNENESRNASQYRKEKERLELRLEESTKSLTDSTSTQDALQSQVNAMIMQVRDLKTSCEESETQRSTTEKSKKAIELRNAELTDQLNEAIRTRLDMNKNVLSSDTKASQLRDQLDEYVESARSASERQRRAEACLADAQNELNKEKDLNLELERAKASLDKSIKDMSSRIMDFEAQPNQNTLVKRMECRIDDLVKQLDTEIREKNDAIKSNRKQERAVRDLELIAGDKEKQKQRFDEEIEKMDQKMKKMKTQLDELEASESNLQLAKRRAEREANEYKDRASRYEKEIERVKGRTERAPGASL